MSFVTTPPEMLASLPSMRMVVTCWNSQDYPDDGAGMNGNRRTERPHNRVTTVGTGGRRIYIGVADA